MQAAEYKEAMLHSITALFAAVTTLLTPRAGEAQMGQGSGVALASGTEACKADAIRSLEQTAFGQFVIHEMRPFSTALLSSEGVAEFERGLDGFIDGELGDRFFAEALTLVEDGWNEESDDTELTLSAALETLRASMVKVLGARHAASIADGLGGSLAVLSHAPIPAHGAIVDAARQVRLSDLLSDVNVPLARRQAALAAMESTACYFALLHLVADERAVAPWLADELIRRWTTGQAAVLRQLEISGDPLAQSRQEMNHLLVNEGYERLARRGATEGVDMWPPEVGNDD